MSKMFALMCTALTLSAIASAAIPAAAVMTLKGTVYSVLKEEFVLQADRELYHIRKDALTPDARKKIETANTREITVDVPMQSILKVRSAKGAVGK